MNYLAAETQKHSNSETLLFYFIVCSLGFLVLFGDVLFFNPHVFINN